MKKVLYALIVSMALYFVLTALTGCAPKFGCGTEHYSKPFNK